MMLARTLIAACLAVTGSAAFAQQTPRAVVCLDEEVKLPQGQKLTVPANAVFRNVGPITGDITGTWRRVDLKGIRTAAVATTEPVVLTRDKRCAEVPVRMYVDGILNRETSAKAADNDVWSLHDVPDYVPGRKPPIEFGKLVDDMALLAQLRSDVADVLTVKAPDDPDALAAQCLVNAKFLVSEISGALLGRQTGAVTFIRHSAVSEMSTSCRSERPDLFAAWDKRAKPSSATAQIIARAASLLTGAPQDKIISLVDACIQEALKPENNEIADAEHDGMRVECLAFTRDGGAGTVTIFRRFGPYPALR